MNCISQPLPGLHILRPRVAVDQRGRFVKTFNPKLFNDLGISFTPYEEFYSSSKRNVIRGMHFQLPPYDHAKLVYCVAGKVVDVLVDLRKNMSTYGECVAVELSPMNQIEVYIPPGIAHGFISLDEESLMIYKTSSEYAPSHDAGIRWDSINYEWPLGGSKSIVSDRDQHLPLLREFQSPF